MGPDIVLKEGVGRSAVRSRVVRLPRCHMCLCLVAAGFYYILTGGNTVHLYRTQDFVNWNESVPSPFISPSEDDAAVAPYSGFPSAASVKGSPPNQYVGVPENAPRRPYIPNWEGSNWTSWVVNVSGCALKRFFCAMHPTLWLQSNDGDICCMHANVSSAYVIWGASTQGGPPRPPLTGSSAGTNAVGIAPMPLTELLAAYF